MHRVIEIPLGIPFDRKGLTDALIVGRSRPHLVLADLGEGEQPAPCLPGVGVARLLQVSLLPRGTEIVGQINPGYLAITGSRMTANLLSKTSHLRTGSGVSDQRLDRH